jgi:hypothetical protein
MSTLKTIVASYFEGLVAGNFKTAADGQRLFYPWSVWGKGYVLPDAHAEQRIRKLLKIYYMVWLPLVIIIVSIASSFGFYYAFAYAFALIPVGLLVYGVVVRSLTQRLLISGERLRLTESLTLSASAYSRAILWFVLLVCTLFIISGIVMILDGQVGLGLYIVLFFGACGTVCGYMLRVRTSN